MSGDTASGKQWFRDTRGAGTDETSSSGQCARAQQLHGSCAHAHAHALHGNDQHQRLQRRRSRLERTPIFRTEGGAGRWSAKSIPFGLRRGLQTRCSSFLSSANTSRARASAAERSTSVAYCLRSADSTSALGLRKHEPSRAAERRAAAPSPPAPRRRCARTWRRPSGMIASSSGVFQRVKRRESLAQGRVVSTIVGCSTRTTRRSPESP